jgi:hypothetical protein
MTSRGLVLLPVCRHQRRSTAPLEQAPLGALGGNQGMPTSFSRTRTHQWNLACCNFQGRHPVAGSNLCPAGRRLCGWDRYSACERQRDHELLVIRLAGISICTDRVPRWADEPVNRRVTNLKIPASKVITIGPRANQVNSACGGLRARV